MSAELATRTFTASADASATARTIFSGSGILLSIIVANTASADVLATFADASGTTLFQLNVPADSSQDWSLEGGVVLDNGLVFSAAGAASTTIASAFYRPQ